MQSRSNESGSNAPWRPSSDAQRSGGQNSSGGQNRANGTWRQRERDRLNR